MKKEGGGMKDLKRKDLKKAERPEKGGRWYERPQKERPEKTQKI